MKRRQALVVLAGSAGSVGAAEWLRPTHKLAETLGPIDLTHAVPMAVGSWRSVADEAATIVNPEMERAIRLKYSDLLNRTYVNAQGYRLMVSVAYGGDQTDAVAVHRPEGCYPAQGFVIDDMWLSQLQTAHGTMPITRLVTHFGTRRPEPVSYWVVIGSQLLTHQRDKKLVDFKYALRNLIPDGVIFRVSSIDPDHRQAFQQHDRFVHELLASLAADKRPRLMGL